MPDNPITSTSSPWYDLHLLNPYQPYNRGDQVTIGNGSLLPIHNTVQGILLTHHHSFKLDKRLHVPSIPSNLVFVQKLAKDNNCSVIFDHSTFSIQDNHSKAILHRGLHANDLYQFSDNIFHASPHAYSCSTSSFSSSASVDTWH